MRRVRDRQVEPQSTLPRYVRGTRFDMSDNGVAGQREIGANRATRGVTGNNVWLVLVASLALAAITGLCLALCLYVRAPA